jgi:hypothetical protein
MAQHERRHMIDITWSLLANMQSHGSLWSGCLGHGWIARLQRTGLPQFFAIQRFANDVVICIINIDADLQNIKILISGAGLGALIKDFSVLM